MTNRRFNFSEEKTITALAVDSQNRYLWQAFDQDLSGNCAIQKVSAFEPSQVFFDFTREVNEIVAMDLNTSNLFVAYNDDSLLGEIISLNNPLTNTTEISIPAGISQIPVSVIVDGTDLWYLVPGTVSGTIAKLLLYNTSGILQQTIELTDINNADSMTIDNNSNIWIVTNTSPSSLIRVYQTSGGLYTFTETILNL